MRLRLGPPDTADIDPGITPVGEFTPVAATSALGRAGVPGRPRPRILFYSHDSYGVGHLARTLMIANEVARRRPDAVLLLLTGSEHAHAFDRPANLDYVKLPVLAKRDLFLAPHLGQHRSADAPRQTGDLWRLRATLIEAAATAFVPDVLLVDHQPLGPKSEIVPTLDRLRDVRPRPTLILGLTDEFDDPMVTRLLWERAGAHDHLDRTYDRILVYGSRDVFDPVAEYGLSRSAAAKTAYCGYLAGEPPRIAAAQIRAELDAGEAPLVVVAPGGGADGAALVRAYLGALASPALAGLVSFVVTGPLLADPERSEMEAAAGRLGRVTLVPFTPDLVSYYAAADLVLTMGGLTNLANVLALGKRAIAVPRVRPWKEQWRRAERFAARGLLTLIHPFVLTPDRLGRAILDCLAAPPPAVDLDFDGVRRVGDELEAALARHAR